VVGLSKTHATRLMGKIREPECRAEELMRAARTVDEPGDISPTPPPQHESPAAELARIAGPERRAAVWRESVETYGARVMAAAIRQIAETSDAGTLQAS
jgi:hypothetical protein